MTLATEHGFAWPRAFAMPLHGWALAAEGRVAEGIDEMGEALAAQEQMGHRLWRPHQQGLLAAALAGAGRTADALAVVMQAIDAAERTGEQEHAAELHRQRGELVLLQGIAQAEIVAEQCFVHAVQIARRQQARSWELRAATSLARLWHRQGRNAQAGELLGPVYGRFTEGLDTPDLRDAGTLLDALAKDSADPATVHRRSRPR